MYKCYFCDAEVDEDYLCYGCGEAYCVNCDKRCPSATGFHAPEAHEACEFGGECGECAL